MVDGLMRKVTRRSAAVVILLGLIASSAFAHKVNVFAAYDKGVIQGEAYFLGGGRMKNCTVEFFDASGRKQGETRTDANGNFHFQPDRPRDLRIVVDGGDGHRAEYILLVDESANELPASGETAENATNVEAAPIQSLRAQARRQERRTQMVNIIGGLGWIFGLAWMVLYFQERRKRKK